MLTRSLSYFYEYFFTSSVLLLENPGLSGKLL